MCGTVFIVSLYLEQEVKTDVQESRLTSHRRWRCGTTSVCRAGWRSPTLNRSGFAGPNTFVTPTWAPSGSEQNLLPRRPPLRALVNEGERRNGRSLESWIPTLTTYD